MMKTEFQNSKQELKTLVSDLNTSLEQYQARCASLVEENKQHMEAVCRHQNKVGQPCLMSEIC